MKYLVFNTEQEAEDAEALISAKLGYSKAGINALTGKVEPNILTTRWAVPQQTIDGRWVFPSPNDEGEEYQVEWFINEENYETEIN